MDEQELFDDMDRFEMALELDVMASAIDIPSEPSEWTDVVSFGPLVLGFKEA